MTFDFPYLVAYTWFRNDDPWASHLTSRILTVPGPMLSEAVIDYWITELSDPKYAPTNSFIGSIITVTPLGVLHPDWKQRIS